jgi:hypothetical protein
LAALEDVHRAYCIATRSNAAPLTVGDLGIFAFFITHDNGRWLPTLSMYWIPGNMDAWVPRALSDVAQVQALEVMLTRLRAGDPFALFAERIQRAQAALEAGDFSDAVVDAAVATEILLDAVLSFMLWEEKATPREAKAVLADPLATRVKTAYHQRIGGRWDSTREPVLKAWDDDVMLRRHRVVHRGIRPTESEAHRALDGARALERWITELVVAKRFAYMRTTLLMVGIPGLQRRDLWSQRMRAALASTGEGPDSWVPDYIAWRTALT